MKTTVVFFAEGQNGKYIQIRPDFVIGEFTPLDILPISGLEFRPFGFSKNRAISTLIRPQPSIVAQQKDLDEVRVSTFESLIKGLSIEIEEKNFNTAYILIKIVKDEFVLKFWLMSADYQYLLKEKED